MGAPQQAVTPRGVGAGCAVRATRQYLFCWTRTPFVRNVTCTRPRLSGRPRTLTPWLR